MGKPLDFRNIKPKYNTPAKKLCPIGKPKILSSSNVGTTQQIQLHLNNLRLYIDFSNTNPDQKPTNTAPSQYLQVNMIN